MLPPIYIISTIYEEKVKRCMAVKCILSPDCRNAATKCHFDLERELYSFLFHIIMLVDMTGAKYTEVITGYLKNQEEETCILQKSIGIIISVIRMTA